MTLNFRLIIAFLVISLNASAANFTLLQGEKNIKNSTQIQLLFLKYHRKNIENNLHDFLSTTRPSRLVGSPGHSKAIQYLYERLSLGDMKDQRVMKEEFTPDIDYAKRMYDRDFEEKIIGKFPPESEEYRRWSKFTSETKNYIEKYRTIKGTNVVWEKKGTLYPEQIVILTAHFDTVVHNLETFTVDEKASMPGADDNASGVVALLSLVEMLKVMNTPKTVRVVFFDYEELGFLGSFDYARTHIEELSKEKIWGLINLEMIGHDSKKDDKTKRYGNMRLYTRDISKKESESDLKLANVLTNYGKRLKIKTDFEIVSNGFDHSDHINFWGISGLPVVTFSENWEDDFNDKRYHTSNDFAETLNMNTYYDSFKYVSAGIISWLFDLK